MNKIILSLSIALISFFPLGVVSSHPGGDDVAITDVQEFTVDGIDVLLRESREAPAVTAVLYIKGGTSYVPLSEPPSTEYFAMTVVPGSGTELTSKTRFRRVMNRMGSGISASDGRDYSLMLMRSTREQFDTTWKFFSEIIVHPTIDLQEFQNIQRNAIVGIQSRRDDPDFLSRTVIDSIYFAGHPYGRRPMKEDMEAQTAEHVLAYYKSIMIKSRMLLVVCGSISRSELEKKMRASGMTSLPQGKYIPPEIPIPAKSNSPGAYFPPIDRKLPTHYVIGFHRVPSKGDPDYYPYLRLRNFFGGFLFQHLRVQSNLAYAPNNEDFDTRSAVEMITFQTPYVDSAIRMVYRDVDFFQQNILLESVIRGNVAKWTTSNFLKQETTIEQATNLGQAQLLTGSWRNAFVSFDKLASVKAEDIQRVAVTYFKNFNWVVVGDTSTVDKKLLESR
ncbi:MAG: pitrilysin family protein [bacterium]